MRRKPLPPGVVPGQPVNSSGSYYTAEGMFMNADGTRSIFDDVDEDGTEDNECSSCARCGSEMEGRAGDFGFCGECNAEIDDHDD